MPPYAGAINPSYSGTTSKPIPASEEAKREPATPKAPAQPGYAQTDVLQSPALAVRSTPPQPGYAPAQDPRFSFYAPDDKGMLKPVGQEKVLDEYQKLHEKAYTEAEQSTSKLENIVALQRTLANLRETDIGWGTKTRVEAMEAINSTMKFVLGPSAPAIKEKEVASYQVFARRCSRDTATLAA